MAKHIQWYPGHIAKAQRQLKEKLSLVDVIIEVIDARIPYSSWYKTTQDLCGSKPRIILMNKGLNKCRELIEEVENEDIDEKDKNELRKILLFKIEEIDKKMEVIRTVWENK